VTRLVQLKNLTSLVVGKRPTPYLQRSLSPLNIGYSDGISQGILEHLIYHFPQQYFGEFRQYIHVQGGAK